MTRVVRSTVLVALPFLVAASAHAEPTRNQCFEAYEGGQRSRKKSELLAAEHAFIMCADPKCPSAIRKECTSWVSEVQKEIPSIVIVARDPSGNDLSQVEVQMDGKPFASQLDGTPREVDPALHRFRFVPARGSPVEREWVIRSGEKGRVFSITLGERPAKPASAKPAPSPVPYVLGGVGVVGLGLFTYFGLHGRSIQNDLDDRGCKPGCPKDEADEMDRSYLIANVSLVVGVAALGGATYFYFSDRSRVGVGLGSVAARF